MVLILQELYHGYRKVMDEYADSRTKNWLLVSNPMILVTIMAGYFYFCSIAGPRFMEKRKPYELKTTLIVYNAFQILLNTFLVYEASAAMWRGEYNIKCQTVDYSNNPVAVKIASNVWWYYFAKITELLDTVFFVLRKKNKQITTLHLFHHTVMPMIAWMGVRYFAGGHNLLFGALNSLVHIFMYTYYLIAGLGPEYQKYVWWKKYLTAFQLVQFCIILLHNIVVLFRECAYPRFLNYLAIFETALFLYMFGRFYYEAYVGKSEKRGKKLSDINEKKRTNEAKNKIC